MPHRLSPHLHLSTRARARSVHNFTPNASIIEWQWSVGSTVADEYGFIKKMIEGNIFTRRSVPSHCNMQFRSLVGCSVPLINWLMTFRLCTGSHSLNWCLVHVSAETASSTGVSIIWKKCIFLSLSGDEMPEEMMPSKFGMLSLSLVLSLSRSTRFVVKGNGKNAP